MSNASIAVFHDRLDLFGGGEAVCVAAVEALQQTHDVTVFTRAQPPVAELNDYYGASVDPAAVAFESAEERALGRAGARAGDVAEATVGVGLQSLQRAAFVRWVRRRTRGFDLVLSTAGEHGFDPPTVVYYHKHDRPALDRADALRRRLAGLVEGGGPAGPPAGLLANSAWTADAVAADYGVRPRVVYPPVDTRDLDGGLPWDERESGFVSVGRIEPVKKVLRNVEIVSRLRDRGHDVHLHLVGPTQDGDYGERVAAAAARRGFVHLEGRVERAELVRLLGRHRYGIHGREPEHFGIAVAEMVASGMLPFVPNCGGQREVVGRQDALCYDSVADAVAAIEAVIDSPERQRRLRASLPDVGTRFGREQFAVGLRAVVDEVLGGDRTGESRPAGVVDGTAT